MSEHGIVKSIEKDNHEWNVLFKQRKKTTEQQKQKREKFKKEMDKFFWPVCPKYEKILEKSNDPKKKEDYAWLQRLKMGKPATLGPLDRVYQRRVQRRDHQQHQESGLASTPSTSSSSSVRGTLGPGCEQRFRQRIIEQHIDRDLLMTTDGCRKNDPDFIYKEQAPRNQEKKDLLSNPGVCLVADKYQMSHRAVTAFIGEVHKAQDEDLDDAKLSVMNSKRKRDTTRTDHGKKFLNNNLEKISGQGVLHWDGKIFKKMTHAGSSKERVAILIDQNGEDVLLGVPIVEEGNAKVITSEILNTLNKLQIEYSKIIGVVFDTTSVNSGYISGVVVNLEKEFGQSLLQLACRHHIAELVCGAACTVVYGETESPKETSYVAFAEAWPDIIQDQYELYNIKGRFLNNLKKEVLKFLQHFMDTESQSLLRDDYKELVLLSILFLGGSRPEGIKFYAPGAQHHARWMAAIIYTIKISLFAKQLDDVFEKWFLDTAKELATFLVLFYVKYWLCCTSASDAAVLDLNFLQQLEKAKLIIKDHNFLKFIEASSEKLKQHLWYLSERLVPIAFFSSRVDNQQKSEMAKELLSYEKVSGGTQDMPLPEEGMQFSSMKLKQFVGSDSWTFFTLMGVSPDFLHKPVSEWCNDASYLQMQNFIKTLSVVNDSAERALGMMTEFHVDRITRSEQQRQHLLQVVKEMRLRQKNLLKHQNDERCTKAIIKKIKYD